MVKAYVHRRSAALSAGRVIRYDDDARDLEANYADRRLPLKFIRRNESANYYKIRREALAVYGDWAAKRAKQAYDIRLKREEASERAISVFKIVTHNLADQARPSFGFTRSDHGKTGIVPSIWYTNARTGEPLQPDSYPHQQVAVDTLTEHTNTVDRFADIVEAFHMNSDVELN